MKFNFRYMVIGMVALITIINYIDRGAIAYAQEAIIKEFNLDPEMWGNILGYFGYGYMVGALFGGILADRKGPRFVWLLAGTVWSIFEMSTAWAGDIGIALFGGSALAGFAVFRVLFGAAEGPALATMNRTVANWASQKERGFASGLSLLGVPLGAMLTAPVAVGLLSVTNWRATFVILGIIGIVWVIVWAKIFTNNPEEHPKVSEEELAEIRSARDLLHSERTLSESNQVSIPWYHFFKNPTMVLNSLGFFAFQYINFLLLTWTPKYLQDVFHFKLSSLWYLGMIPWIGACFTVVIGGKISDGLRRRTGNLRIARSGVAVVSLFLTTLCFISIPFVHSIGAVLLLVAIGNAFNSLPNSVYWAIITDTEPSKAGSYSGVSLFIMNIAAIVAPTLTGVLVATNGYSAMFVAAAIATSMGMIAMIFVKPGKSSTRITQKSEVSAQFVGRQ